MAWVVLLGNYSNLGSFFEGFVCVGIKIVSFCNSCSVILSKKLSKIDSFTATIH